jgi:glucosamine-6-phosphate deaminase
VIVQQSLTAIADVPQQAITQGLGTIMEARSIILIAQGASKAAAVAAAVEGPRSESCPASVLQDHDQVTFVLDVAAAAGLTQIEAVSGVR